MGKKSWKETFRTTGIKFWSEILSPGEKFGNFTLWSHLKMTDPRFWSQAGQNNRIEIFGCGAAKMGKNPEGKLSGLQA